MSNYKCHTTPWKQYFLIYYNSLIDVILLSFIESDIILFDCIQQAPLKRKCVFSKESYISSTSEHLWEILRTKCHLFVYERAAPKQSSTCARMFFQVGRKCGNDGGGQSEAVWSAKFPSVQQKLIKKNHWLEPHCHIVKRVSTYSWN